MSGRRRPASVTIGTIAIVRGVCRWCGCTEENACEGGCFWVDFGQSLCSECVPLDTALKTTTGQRLLAAFLQEQQFALPRLTRRAPKRKEASHVSR